MNTSIEAALARLRKILPLEERQGECTATGRNVHRQILHGFISNGRMLDPAEMAQCVDDPGAALAELRASDLLTFAANGDPVGAYPFTSEAREHRVRVNGYWIHAMCALDALAISPMFDERVVIASRCRLSGEAIEIQQSGMRIENLPAVADVQLGIDWGAVTADACCADSLCLQMLYLRDGEFARQWVDASRENREVFDLPEAIDLASRFFVPLLR